MVRTATLLQAPLRQPQGEPCLPGLLSAVLRGTAETRGRGLARSRVASPGARLVDVLDSSEVLCALAVLGVLGRCRRWCGRPRRRWRRASPSSSASRPPVRPVPATLRETSRLMSLTCEAMRLALGGASLLRRAATPRLCGAPKPGRRGRGGVLPPQARRRTRPWACRSPGPSRASSAPRARCCAASCSTTCPSTRTSPQVGRLFGSLPPLLPRARCPCLHPPRLPERPGLQQLRCACWAAATRAAWCRRQGRWWRKQRRRRRGGLVVAGAGAAAAAARAAA